MELALGLVGGVAAASTLTAEFIRLAKALRKCANSVKYANKAIHKLALETSIFADLLNNFMQIAQGDSGKSLRKKSLAKLEGWSHEALRGLKSLLDRVDILNGKDGPTAAKITAHIAWYISKDAVKYFRDEMSVARESMNGYINIRCLEVLNQQLQAILQGRSRDALSEQDLESVRKIEANIRVKRVMRHEYRERQKIVFARIRQYEQSETTQTLVPRLDILEDFSSAVRSYEDRVISETPSIPREEPRRQRHVAPMRQERRASAPETTINPIQINPVFPPQRPREDFTRREIQTSFMPDATAGHIWLSRNPSETSSSSCQTPPALSSPVLSRASTPQPSISYSRSTRGKQYYNNLDDILANPRPIPYVAPTISEPLTPPTASVPPHPSNEIQRARSAPMILQEDSNMRAVPSVNHVTERTTTLEVSITPAVVDIDGRVVTATSDYDESEVSDLEEGFESEAESEGPSPFVALTGRSGKYPPSWQERRRNGE